VEEMAKELEALRSQREEAGLRSFQTPSLPDSSMIGSPEYTMEQPGTVNLSEVGIRGEYQLGTFTIDRDTVVDIFKV
jgi:hypothetical protein